MTSPPAPPERLIRRVTYLDSLRALAALYVLIHHAFCMPYPISHHVHATGTIGTVFGWAIYGHFGVTIFIVLAGWSLTLGVARRGYEVPGGSVLAFLRRRAWRIIPPYWAALALTIVLVLTVIGKPQGTHWDLSVPTDPRGWASDFLLVQDVLPYRDAAYTFWSIAVEWHIYLALPAILLIRRRANWGTAMALTVLLPGIGVLAARAVPQLGRLHFEYVMLFGLAMGACAMIHERPIWIERLPWLIMGGALAGGVVALAIVQPYEWMVPQYDWIDIILGCAVICLLVALSTGQARRTAHLLENVALAKVGEFSYSLYLVHAPLLAFAWLALVKPFVLSPAVQLAVLWLVGVPIIVAASYLFHVVAERPFILHRDTTALRAAYQVGVRGRHRVVQLPKDQPASDRRRDRTQAGRQH